MAQFRKRQGSCRTSAGSRLPRRAERSGSRGQALGLPHRQCERSKKLAPRRSSLSHPGLADPTLQKPSLKKPSLKKPALRGSPRAGVSRAPKIGRAGNAGPNPSAQIRASDLQSKSVDFSELHQPDPAVADDVARSNKTSATKAGADLPATGRPLDVSLLILLGSLGGALILFALAGRSFLYR